VNFWIENIDEMEENPKRGNTHKYAYYEAKEEFPRLYSNVIQEAMNRAIEIMRNRSSSMPIYESDSMSFKPIDVKYNQENIGIPVIGKRKVWMPLIVPKYFSKYKELEKGRLQVAKKGEEWYNYVSMEYPIKKQKNCERVLGVDLGIRQIAVLSSSDGKINEFYGSEVLSKHRELIQRREKLQKEKRGDNKKYQALQRLSGKDERFMDNINHNISKDIVEKAKHHSCIIAIENLKRLRDNAPSKELRKMLHQWSYRDLSRKIEYKAEAAGIPVKYVDPRKTSKNCSKCGKENKVEKSKQ
jgi:putative transposase